MCRSSSSDAPRNPRRPLCFLGGRESLVGLGCGVVAGLLACVALGAAGSRTTLGSSSVVATVLRTGGCGCVGGVGSGEGSATSLIAIGSEEGCLPLARSPRIGASRFGVGVGVGSSVDAGASSADDVALSLLRDFSRTPKTVRTSSWVEPSSPLAAVANICAVVRSNSALLAKNSASEPWLFHSTNRRWISSPVSPRLCSRYSRRIGSMSRESLMTCLHLTKR